MGGAGRPVMGMPAQGVGHRRPRMKVERTPVLTGPQPQMELAGYGAVGQKSHVEAGDGLVQDPLERRIVVFALEDSQSRISPVEGISR